MGQNRKLTELYVTKKVVTLGDDDGTVKVVVRKLNPLQQAEAVREANAARAKVLAQRRNEASDAYEQQLVQAMDMSRESLVDILIAEELNKARLSAEEELRASDEWAEDDYLQGLEDSWENELKDRHAGNPDDPEVKPVFDALAKFADQVDEKVMARRERLTKQYADMPEDELVDQAVKKLIDFEADSEWLREYRQQEIYHSVWNEDGSHHFDSRSEVSELQPQILTRLMDEIRELSVGILEGKE